MCKFSLRLFSMSLIAGLCFGQISFGVEPVDDSEEQTTAETQESTSQSGDETNQRPRRRPGDLRIPDKLNVGDRAPRFRLHTIDGLRTVSLSDYRGQQPVVLIFGSYT